MLFRSGAQARALRPGTLPRGAASRIRWVAAPVHPPELLERVEAVYVVTSQMGFEALLWGRPVRCFGMPFYAGWGLSGDDQAAPARRGAASLEQLVHAALIDYPLCLDPQSGLPCTPETLMHWMGWQRAMRQRFPEHLLGLGFTRWKQSLVRDFVQGSQVQFAPRRVRPRAEDTVLLWGREPLPAGTRPAGVLRLEDGFVRSVGLGGILSTNVRMALDHTERTNACSGVNVRRRVNHRTGMNAWFVAGSGLGTPPLRQSGKVKIRLIGHDPGAQMGLRLHRLVRPHNDTGRLCGGQLRDIAGVAEKAQRL